MNERTRTRQPAPGEHTTVQRANRGRVYDKQEVEGPPLPVRDENKPWGKVRIGGGVTRNMGDFESVRVDVSIEMACENTQEDVDALVEHLSNYVEDVIISELDKAMGVPANG